MDLAPHWWWLIAAGLLAIAELIAPGVYLIWLGGAALITGLVTLATGVDPIVQALLFAGLAVALVYVARRWFAEVPIETSDPLLNDRVGRLIGEQVLVVDAIAGGRGRVRVGDGEWPARGPDAPAGSRVTVLGGEGACLIVGSPALPRSDQSTEQI